MMKIGDEITTGDAVSMVACIRKKLSEDLWLVTFARGGMDTFDRKLTQAELIEIGFKEEAT